MEIALFAQRQNRAISFYIPIAFLAFLLLFSLLFDVFFGTHSKPKSFVGTLLMAAAEKKFTQRVFIIAAETVKHTHIHICM